MNIELISLGLHLLVVAVVSLRVIMKRPEPGVALAWLFLVAIFPFFGALAYLLIGERRIDPWRAERIAELQKQYQDLFGGGSPHPEFSIDWSRHKDRIHSLDRLGRHVSGSATVPGSDLELYSDTDQILQSIVADIDAAQTSVFMEFYIWSEGGVADTVLDSLIKARRRGVACHVLVDAIGARPWLRGHQPDLLSNAGVRVVAALPTGPLQSLIGRTDLRLHRKIVVVDNNIAWTGSLNLVDPAYFKQEKGVGKWIDAMVRAQGLVVSPLLATMLGDWVLETGEDIGGLAESTGVELATVNGDMDIQVIASGPGGRGDGILQMLLALIHYAQTELIITTPYLVPEGSVRQALRGAAARGVDVTIIVPERVDSVLTRHASRSYFVELMELGVSIRFYREGLLHTKSITVDGEIAMFGTANLDMRSMWLNYEATLFVYDPDFVGQLRELQQSYFNHSAAADLAEWRGRPYPRRLLENTIRLMSPLL